MIIIFKNNSNFNSNLQARAVIQRLEKFDETEGKIVIDNILVSVSRPEVHAKVHESENSVIEVTRLISLMKEELARDPELPPSKSQGNTWTMAWFDIIIILFHFRGS